MTGLSCRVGGFDDPHRPQQVGFGIDPGGVLADGLGKGIEFGQIGIYSLKGDVLMSRPSQPRPGRWGFHAERGVCAVGQYRLRQSRRYRELELGRDL